MKILSRTAIGPSSAKVREMLLAMRGSRRVFTKEDILELY
jgi:membrane peptidoglycan carboxypeptidase